MDGWLVALYIFCLQLRECHSSTLLIHASYLYNVIPREHGITYGPFFPIQWLVSALRKSKKKDNWEVIDTSADDIGVFDNSLSSHFDRTKI